MSTSANGPAVGNGPASSFDVIMSNRVDVIDTAGGRILCVADIRGESIGGIWFELSESILNCRRRAVVNILRQPF